MSGPATIQLHDAVLAALQAQDNLDVLDGAIDDTGEPTYRNDPDGRAHMTAVLWWSTEYRQIEDETVCGARPLTALPFQVTCVGGDQNRAIRAAAKTAAALSDVCLTAWSGPIREDTERSTVQRDPSATPARWYLPIHYTVQMNPAAAPGD